MVSNLKTDSGPGLKRRVFPITCTGEYSPFGVATGPGETIKESSTTHFFTGPASNAPAQTGCYFYPACGSHGF